VRAVFALDRCTDDTQAALRTVLGDDAFTSGRVEIVSVDACPDDWHGKPHAAHEGVTRASKARDAELLLFVDADTRFAPMALRAAVALMQLRELGVLSVLSTLEVSHWWEKVAQPWAGFELMRKYPIDRINREKNPIGFANGQFMLFTRQAYDCVGGHEAVRRHVLEDIALAIRAKKRNVQVNLYFADGLFRCAMYDSWDAFRQGWKRIFIEGFRRRPARLRTAAGRLLVMGVGAPLASAVVMSIGAAQLFQATRWRAPIEEVWFSWVLLVVGVCGLAAWFTAAASVLRSQRLPVRWAVLAPAGALCVVRILHRAALDLKRGRPMQWGGREFVRQERT